MSATTVSYASNFLTWLVVAVVERLSQVALERGAHPFFIAKTAAAGNAVDTLLSFFQQAPSGFQSEHFDCFAETGVPA